MTAVDDVVWMVRGAWISLCLRAACELGVMDALDGPRDLIDLARRTSCDPAALFRLLRVLVDLGLVGVDGEHFRATVRGELLRADHPSGLHSLAMMQTVVPNLTAWHHLADAVRRGGPVFEGLQGMSSWDWLTAHPQEEAVFNAAMARRSVLQVAALQSAYDLSSARVVVDVGGGEGAMLAGLLRANPYLRGIVADRPPVAAAATKALDRAGLGRRAHGQPVDFFDSVPSGGDVYVLANVIHDWDDSEAVAILRTVRRAMGPEGHLLLVENVLDAPDRTATQQRDVHLVDLHMLVMFGARERTKQEYDTLLAEAGLATSTIAASPNTWTVLSTNPEA